MESAKTQYSIDFKGSASSAVAPVQVVQQSGAKVVQNSGSANCTGCTSILDVEISCFANYRATEPRAVNLLKWLKSDKYASEVKTIRQTTDKSHRDNLKSTLPAITPSGIFSKREVAGLIKHSGFIQFDIDIIKDIQTAKAKIISLSNVAYCGLSVSGRGLWGLIPIAYPDHHKEYFYLIEKAFAGMGIKVDTSCKDVSRLRGYSYDPGDYFNHNATPLIKWFEPKKREHHKRNYKPIYGNNNASHVEKCLQQITARNIDLTVNYSDWFSVGCSLANEFGEAGRNYFHTVSQFHPEYDYQNTDKQFTQCLKHKYSTTIATFFKACADVGVTFKNCTGANVNFETLTSSGFKWCNPKDHIGIAPVAPVGKKVPDLPKWFVDGQGILKQYEAGEITNIEYLDLLQSNFEDSSLSGKEYVRQTNDDLAWECKAKVNLKQFRGGEIDNSTYETKQAKLCAKYGIEPEIFVERLNLFNDKS